MAVLPFYVPKFRAFDSNGDPLSGGLLYSYAAGTTTPLSTYTTRAGDVANANPVVLDANGEADVWTTPSVDYKFVLKDSAGVTQWTVDNVPSLPDVSIIPLELGDGSASAPALSFVNDPDCGLYRSGSESVSMAANGVERQRWTADGTTIPGDASVEGSISMTGSNPASSEAHTNELTSMNLIKAWGRVSTDGSGGATLVSGFNISEVTATATQIECTLAAGLSGATGMALGGHLSGNRTAACNAGPTTIDIVSYIADDGTQINPSTTALTVQFIVLGAQ